MKSEKAPIRVLVSGAAGQIGYALIPLLAGGQAFGLDQPVILHLLDIEPSKQVLQGVVMEIEDGAYELVHGVIGTTNYEEAFNNIDVAVLVGGFPRGKGMDRKDLLAKNKPIFVAAGEALEKYANPNVKVLVVANPANTNCLIAASNAPSVPKENFTALTFLDMNRAKWQLAAKLGCTVSQVKNAIIWGNHSKTQVPDAYNAKFIDKNGDETSVSDAIDDDSWLMGSFLTTVQDRGAAVINARGLSSAMSASNAIKDHLNAWICGTKPGDLVSMAVYTDGTYGIKGGIFFSFPVTCDDGTISIEKDLSIKKELMTLIKASEKELLEEKAEACI